MYEVIENYIDQIIRNFDPVMPLWNIESILGKKSAKWNYIDGCMLNAFIALYEETNDNKYLDFVIKFVDYYVDDNGNILGFDPNNKVLDDVCESRILFDLYQYLSNNKYYLAIENTYRQIKIQPRIKEGNFIHKPIYPNQLWLDGLYMVMPFYIRYEKTFNGYRNLDDIVNQYKNVRKIMFNEEDKLYYHGFDSSKNIFWCDKLTGLSKNYWLRSIGWYLISLIDVIEYIDVIYKYERDELINIFKEAIEGVLLYLDKSTNMFYQVVNKGQYPGNYVETSGSSMISYALLKGVRIGVLDQSYQDVGKNIFNGICSRYLSVTKDDFKLGGICLVAGLGPSDNIRRDGTYNYYISEPVVVNDGKGVAPFILAYTEIKRIV